MLMIGFDGMVLSSDHPITQAILAQQIGGVILFDYNFQTKKFERNIKNPQQLQSLTQQLQNYNELSAKQHQNQLVPLLIGIDYEGGQVNRLKESYGFPKTLSAAELGTGSQEQAIQYADTMAKTLQQAGINFNFAPVVDVNVNPDNPVIGKLARSFSSDPKKVIEYAKIFAAAFKKHGIIFSYKHFPGHGSSLSDTHAGFVDITKTWREYELEPYQQLLKNSEDEAAVLTSHVVHYDLDHQGMPASLSTEITTELLRKKLKFNGVVITDDLQMKAITDNYPVAETVRLAINAGADILVFGNQLVKTAQDPAELIEMIYSDVKSGKISEHRVDEAYQRIIKLKQNIKIKEYYL